MIRDFLIQDKQELLNLADEFYNSPAVSHPIPVKNFENCYDEILKGNPFLRGLSIVYDEKIVGYLQLSFTYSSEADGLVVLFEELYISPSYQGKGLSKEVFAFIDKEYKDKAKRYRLECCADNTHALKLYEKQGFEYLPYLQMIKEDLN